MSAFEIFLRTGRRIMSAVETKFNPWHDPEDGRFTFAGQGRYFAGAALAQRDDRGRDFRGGGGSFGGGGAGGSWEPTSRPSRSPIFGGGSSGGGASGSWTPEARQRSSPVPSSPRPAIPPARTAYRSGTAHPRLTVRKNGYDFSIDAHARTRRVTGEIRLQSQPRSRRAQSDAGKPDRRNSDDGGHYIAARFNGPRDWFNHFAQDANFNRGAYRILENEWANAARSGKRVFVDIVPHYRGTSMRPYQLTVTWYVGAERYSQTFPNEKTRPRDAR